MQFWGRSAHPAVKRPHWGPVINDVSRSQWTPSCLWQFISMPSILVGDRGIVVISFSPWVRTRQVMQKAFIKETYYCTILNRAPVKLAPASMAQLSTRGSRDPWETAWRCDWTWKCWVWVYRVISHADKLMFQTQSNCLYMENRDKHTPRLREPHQNMKARVETLRHEKPRSWIIKVAQHR